ncbi:nucleotidyltransferase domain-containing protein [Lysinibacillus sp. FSL M8-0134]|uniref:nucleotidyltransferase domain-containing protein n=1 Tax=Lysinibacillus sp. FSL M8-0134 TaxID=2921717 RepID=UPI00311A0CFB
MILNNLENIISYLPSYFDSYLTVYLSGSLIEGFGNKSSDIDVFVICEELPDPEDSEIEGEVFLQGNKNLIQNFVIDGIRFDVEYWTKEHLEEVTKKLNSLDFQTDKHLERISQDELVFLHRLKIGKPIINKDYFTKIISSLNINNFHYYQITINSENFSNILEDIQGAISSSDYGSAYFWARDLLNLSISSYLSIYGETNPKNKWIYRKLLSYQENTGDTQLINDYIELQTMPYNEKDIKKHLKKLIQYAQNLNVISQSKLKSFQLSE